MKILQEPEVYEAHVTGLQAQAYKDLAATVAFTDKDMLLSSLCHNHPLYIQGKINGHELNRILVDPGASVNIMPLKTIKSLFLIPFLQMVNDVKFFEFN